MKRRNRVISMIMAATLAVPAFGYSSTPVQAQESNSDDEKSYVIVAEDEAVYEEVAEEIGYSLADDDLLSDNYVMTTDLSEAEAEKLNGIADVMIEEDIVLTGSTAQTEEELPEEAGLQQETEEKTDPEYDWNLQAICAEELSQEPKSGQGIRVAVLDSGVDYVEGMNLEGYVNLIDGQEEFSTVFQDETGHGTAVAGIIAGNGKTGINGIAPGASVYSVKVLDGQNTAPLSRVIEGIYWCIENHMDIINMSFGTPVYSKALECAVKDAYAAGILMVGAAGNDGSGVEYPAAFEEVMAVASASPSASISDFCNTGEELEIAAPGERIRTTSFFNGSMATHGTSIAVPHVTGVAAALWGKDSSKSNVFIRELIRYSAKEMAGTEDCGLLDAWYAEEIYDSFAENYVEDGTVAEEEVPKNGEMPEDYSDVEQDEAYVEGRWEAGGHKDTINANTAGLSTKEVTLLKKGVVYPDTPDSWKGAGKHPWWHGKFALKDNVTEYDYISSLSLVTSIAVSQGNFWIVEKGATLSVDKSKHKETYDKIKANINNLDYSSVLGSYSNTAANRKIFLYGCALHNLTDIFAHSTTNLKGEYLGHGYKYATQTDLKQYHKKSHDVAIRCVYYAIKNLQANTYSGSEVIFNALNDLYDSSADFKIINFLLYTSRNGVHSMNGIPANINRTDVVDFKN